MAQFCFFETDAACIACQKAEDVIEETCQLPRVHLFFHTDSGFVRHVGLGPNFSVECLLEFVQFLSDCPSGLNPKRVF